MTTPRGTPAARQVGADTPFVAGLPHSGEQQAGAEAESAPGRPTARAA